MIVPPRRSWIGISTNLECQATVSVFGYSEIYVQPRIGRCGPPDVRSGREAVVDYQLTSYLFFLKSRTRTALPSERGTSPGALTRALQVTPIIPLMWWETSLARPA